MAYVWQSCFFQPVTTRQADLISELLQKCTVEVEVLSRV